MKKITTILLTLILFFYQANNSFAINISKDPLISLSSDLNFFKTKNTDYVNGNLSILNLAIFYIGAVISLLVFSYYYFINNKVLGLSFESFISKSDQLKKLSNIISLKTEINDFLVLKPGVIFFGDNIPNYNFDIAINLKNNYVIHNESYALSPLIEFGFSNSFVNANYILGGFLKLGFLIKLQDLLFEFFAGYRRLGNDSLSVNSTAFGGSFSYRF